MDGAKTHMKKVIILEEELELGESNTTNDNL